MTAALITSLHGPLKKNFSFDQFEYIANVQREPYALAVRGDSPFKTLKDLIEHTKKNPPLKIGGQGTASQLHLAALALAEDAGIRISWVPFGGGADAITNILGGHIPSLMTSPTTSYQYAEMGKLRILAVTGGERLPYWKDIPTLKELGYNIVVTQYRGFGAKKGLPPEMKAKLVDAIKKAVAEPGFKEYMAKNNQTDAFMGPEEFTAMVRAEYDLMGKLMQKVEHKGEQKK
jgi:putative tricarboxylic transport membrane protein